MLEKKAENRQDDLPKRNERNKHREKQRRYACESISQVTTKLKKKKKVDKALQEQQIEKRSKKKK